MHVGKFLNGYDRFTGARQVPPGWNQWRLVLGNQYYGYDYFVNGHVRHHGRRARDHVTHVLNRDAARLVRRYAPRRRPFYLQLDERAPHTANQSNPHGPCSRAPMPEPTDRNLFRRAGLPKPPSFNEKRMNDKPSFLRSAPRIRLDERRLIRKNWRCGLASLRGVDRGVGHVYDAVKDAGELRKTVFIFTSDNGLFHGQHRRRSGKILPYEEALHLPLVIRAPKRYRGGAPRVKRVRRVVGNIDLAPTILRLAGARPCSASGNCRTMDGRSLMPLLRRSSSAPRRRGLLIEYRLPDADRFATCEFAGIRTRNTLYVRHFRVVEPGTSQCVSTDQRERYNLKRDPFELQNLCFGGSSDRCPIDDQQLDLEARLSPLRNCAGIAGRDEPVDGRPFCE
jgi:N-acetylglucosamine-6-sulfatase